MLNDLSKQVCKQTATIEDISTPPPVQIVDNKMQRMLFTLTDLVNYLV